MKYNLLVLIPIILLLLSACNQSIDSSNIETLKKEMEALSEQEKKEAQPILNQLKIANQISKELEALLIEFQKSDELLEAINMMKIASNELTTVLNTIKDIQTSKPALHSYKVKTEKELMNYIEGLQLQLDGMETMDGEKIKAGFKQVERAKAALIKLEELFLNGQK